MYFSGVMFLSAASIVTSVKAVNHYESPYEYGVCSFPGLLPYKLLKSIRHVRKLFYREKKNSLLGCAKWILRIQTYGINAHKTLQYVPNDFKFSNR